MYTYTVHMKKYRWREGTHQRRRWWFYWILEEWEAASFLGYYNIEAMLSYLVEEKVSCYWLSHICSQKRRDGRAGLCFHISRWKLLSRGYLEAASEAASEAAVLCVLFPIPLTTTPASNSLYLEI